MSCLPKLGARAMSPIIEDAVSSVVSRNRIKEIIRSVGADRFAGLLPVEACERQIMVQPSRRNLVTFDRLDGRSSYINLAAFVMRCPNDCFSRDLGLENRGHRLGVTRELGFAPTELRRVQCRHLHHRQMNIAVVVYEFRTQGIGETQDSVLSSAVGRL